MSNIHKSLIALLKQLEVGSVQVHKIKKKALDEVEELGHLFEGYIQIIININKRLTFYSTN